MKNILIIGDSCQDIFVYGKCERISPEAPVPIFNPVRVTDNGGMSLNVLKNLKMLDVGCDIVTNGAKPVKTRYVDEISNQMLLRVDEYDTVEKITKEDLKKINFDDYFAIVVSDYNKGFLNEEDIKYITSMHNLVFLDTKKKIGDWVDGVEFIKINNKEFNENSEYLMKHYSGELIITLGKDGTRHWFTDYPIETEHEVRDLSGAGDTFLAALVASYIKNNDICGAINFANKCASWVVTQKGVVAVDLNKIGI